MLGEGPRFIIENQQIRSPDGLVAKRLSYAEMAILIALIDAKGNAVSRDKLMILGWPGKIVVANSLNMAISSLRRMLRELEIGNVIVTIPKVGFRLEKHYLLAYINGDLCEEQHNNFSSSNVALEVEFNNHEGTIREVADELVDIAKPRNHHGLFFKKTISLILFFNLFSLLQLTSHKPRLACEIVTDGVQVCARDIDSKMIIAVRRYLSTFSIKKPVLIWAERNPHQEDGFKLYIVGEPNYVR